MSSLRTGAALVLHDIAASPAGSDGANPYLDSGARFLNEHTGAGVGRERTRPDGYEVIN